VLHLGTDGAGSLRIPAAFTGVFGIKPSFGQVAAYPAVLLSVLAHHGPITATVEDAALMLSVIAQPNARDMTAWNRPAPDFTAGLDDGVRGLRVAFSARLGHVDALDPDIEAGARQAARALEEQGALVEEADLPLERALELIRAMWWPVAAAVADGAPRWIRAFWRLPRAAEHSPSATISPPIPRAPSCIRRCGASTNATICC
jgi:aspartyl-tRNA(Asn)/glutamyl-tRNA(Gln) amidotransferase subunit A